MRHASSLSSGTGRFYNLLYNLWPELSVFGLRVEVLLTDLWHERCYWEGDVISFCLLDVFIRSAYYGGFSSSSEDLIGPLFKIVPHCFSCKTIGWKSQDVSKLLSVMVIDSGFVPVILYSLLLDILCGHWIPITFFSCLLWKLFSFLWSSFDTPQVPQLYNSTRFTSVSYSLILVVTFVFQVFFQITSFFAKGIVANSFLLWMSSDHQALIPVLSHFSIFFPVLLILFLPVVYSVFLSFTNRFLLFIISFAFS